jgi:release factor glutamine methyltransferase
MNGQEEQWLLQEKYQNVKSEAFYADCKRLALGEPLGYLIGSVPFLGCEIWLDSRPLIPRVETEYWTEHALTEIKKHSSPTVLDLCAGSGCIGVAVAKAAPSSHVDFSEIDQSHIPTIMKNLVQNQIEPGRATVYHANLFSGITGTYDFILSNPPYIDPAVDRATDSVKHHEPFIALYGGELGLEIVKDIINQAPAHLNPHGQLWLEHEPEQSLAIEALAAEAGFIATTHLDQYNVERYSILVLQ